MGRAKSVVLRPHFTSEERQQLEKIATSGKTSAQQVNRAHMILQAADGVSVEEIAKSFRVCPATVTGRLERFRSERLEALHDRPRPGRPLTHTGKQEAKLIALACTPAPGGRVRWTLRLLAAEASRLEIFPEISHRGVRLILKKAISNRGSMMSGVSPRLMQTFWPKWKRRSIFTNSPTTGTAR